MLGAAEDAFPVLRRYLKAKAKMLACLRWRSTTSSRHSPIPATRGPTRTPKRSSPPSSIRLQTNG